MKFGRSLRIAVATVGAFALAAGLPACGGGPSGPLRPGIVVVLVDQLTKKASDAWMPGVQGLVDDGGVRFDRMRSTAPWTYPSVISLLSGLYPQQHGATGHPSEQTLSTFDAAVPLLPRLLRAEGYRTAAFVTNPFLHDWHPFHTAFDTFDAGFINNQGAERMGEAYVTENMYANSVNPAVRAHFDAAPPRQPEFTYVHYMDVHGPWREGVPFDADYESAVRYADERLVELYGYFHDRYDGNLLFFVVSDHGMAFREDRRRGNTATRKSKASMYDFNLRVPFLVLPGDAVTWSGVVDLPCSTVDFVPTLADWLGIPLGYEPAGRSLLPAVRGLPMAERPSYALMRSFSDWSDCVVYGGKKYLRIFHWKTGQVLARQVFDLEADPEETVSLGDDFGDMQETLDRLAGTQGVEFPVTFGEVDPDVREGLEALGYLN